MNGKGDKGRPMAVARDEFRANHDRTFSDTCGECRALLGKVENCTKCDGTGKVRMHTEKCCTYTDMMVHCRMCVVTDGVCCSCDCTCAHSPTGEP